VNRDARIRTTRWKFAHVRARAVNDRAAALLLALLATTALGGCTRDLVTVPPDTSQPCGGVGTICTVAGIPGQAGYNGDDKEMTKASLYWPQDVAVSSAGELIVLDWNNHRVRGCSLATQTITTVVGSGDLGDGVSGAATQVNMNHPTGVTWDSQGRLVVAAWHNWKIKRVNDDGTIQVIAGSKQGFAGDGGAAVGATPAAMLDLPSSVVYDGAGNMYISDQGNGRVRRVDTAGVITTFAGVGGQAYGGDDGPASAAQFNFPKGSDAFPAGKIAIDPDKNYLYVADTGNNRVRVIDIATGVIKNFAGNGQAGYAGDNVRAVDAQLNLPTDVAVGPDHAVYIADSRNHAIRRVDTNGTITTVAGTGTPGFAGDGGAATSAQLNTPSGIFVDAQNVLYIADTHNQVVRRVQL
jgi:DNA-binding beta-propeller fold protein YncE